ncbi:MAG: tRNA (cytidine(34)-2'-O)-methyltransferase [Alphaproteobacteria bacterium]|nr:tRNA (cytidine(34)-2'-O)-methyltransferase [Alphaproteobacteria bacterium]
MRLALYEPDIPQNTGTLLRLAACLDVAVDIIEPCGFLFNEKAMRRAGMDYLDFVRLKRHDSWMDFLRYRAQNPDEYGRIVLMTTHGAQSFLDFEFKPNDIILMGRESAGVPENVHQKADARLLIPMNPNARSINMAVSAAMALSEGLRQIKGFPPMPR